MATMDCFDLRLLLPYKSLGNLMGTGLITIIGVPVNPRDSCVNQLSWVCGLAVKDALRNWLAMAFSVAERL